MWSVLDLQTLSVFLWQRFVVGDFHDKTRYALAKTLDDILFFDANVFDGVVKYRCNKDVNIINAANVGEQICNLERMINVWFLFIALAMVAGVTLCGKARSLY
jgi:hypothetical protein